jgi:hypothetical protein
MKNCFSLILFVSITILALSCRDDYTICTLSKDVKFITGFYEKNNVNDVPKTANSLTLISLANNTPLFSNSTNIQSLSLQLNDQVDTMKYVISVAANLQSDTIKIAYTSQSVLLSVDCGNVVNYTISKILSTKHTIDTVKLLNTIVNTSPLQNARIYF